MKLNRATFFLILILQLFIVSCTKCQDIEEVAGLYQSGIDGFMLQNSKIIDNGKNFLKLNSDNTFILFDSTEREKKAIFGTWKINSCKTVDTTTHEYIESALEFTIKNRKINARCLGGRKIIFDNPEDFYGDKDKTLKYIKLSATI